jgi:DNA mismatch repair protein MutL
MLIPQNIELSPHEATTLNANLALFHKLGFEVENFGGQVFAIAAVPPFLVKNDLRELVLEIIGELTEAIVLEDKIIQPVDNILKMMACKSAIKFGDELSREGMESLINDLERLPNKYTCAHGRPAIIEFTFEELKKMFKRK